MNGKGYIFISLNPGKPNTQETKKKKKKIREDKDSTHFSGLICPKTFPSEILLNQEGYKRLATSLSGSNFFHFHTVFGKNVAKQ